MYRAVMIIGLLECDHVDERFSHLAGDYRDMFANLFERHAPQIELKPFDVCNGQWPASLDDCEAYMTTGSKFSVYDDVGWINQLKDFVRRLSDADKPFIGICFGHQMLAEALGGKVARSQAGWGAGVHELDVIEPEPWMTPLQRTCRLQYMHRDQALRLPEKSVVLGGSDHCPIGMFRVGAKMLGIQGHPEFPASYVEALLLDRIERIGQERVNEARSRLEIKTDEGVITKWIARFLEDGIA